MIRPADTIGHLGDFNGLTLAGTLPDVEMGLELAGVPHSRGGVGTALAYLAGEAAGATPAARPASGGTPASVRTRRSQVRNRRLVPATPGWVFPEAFPRRRASSR